VSLGYLCDVSIQIWLLIMLAFFTGGRVHHHGCHGSIDHHPCDGQYPVCMSCAWKQVMLLSLYYYHHLFITAPLLRINHQIKRNGTALSSGTTYVNGETLIVSLPGSITSKCPSQPYISLIQATRSSLTYSPALGCYHQLLLLVFGFDHTSR